MLGNLVVVFAHWPATGFQPGGRDFSGRKLFHELGTNLKKKDQNSIKKVHNSRKSNKPKEKSYKTQEKSYKTHKAPGSGG